MAAAAALGIGPLLGLHVQADGDGGAEHGRQGAEGGKAIVGDGIVLSGEQGLVHQGVQHQTKAHQGQHVRPLQLAQLPVVEGHSGQLIEQIGNGEVIDGGGHLHQVLGGQDKEQGRGHCCHTQVCHQRPMPGGLGV